MYKRLRTAGLIAIVFLIAVTWVVRRTEWGQDLGLPPDPASVQREQREIMARVRALERRALEKTRTVVDLLDGRLTFFEAAAHFLRLNQEFPQQPVYPGTEGSEEERACRQVIQWAHLELQERDADDTGTILAGFERELYEHRKRYGTIRLPPVPSKRPCHGE
jgi:hypothetical protein